MRPCLAAVCILLSTTLATGCASTTQVAGGGGVEADGLPADGALRHALSGAFHGYWTGAASGTVLRARDGALLEIPVVLMSDLESDLSWDMDATDYGEILLERAGHYNSSVWFVSAQIEVAGTFIYITKFEESYEDTLCLELVDYAQDGTMRFQARSFLADPGMGERDACLAGTTLYDATLLLRPGPGDSPEFIENGRAPGDYGAAPPDLDDEDGEGWHEDGDDDWDGPEDDGGDGWDDDEDLDGGQADDARALDRAVVVHPTA